MSEQSTCTIRGVPVTFPFEPYELQKAYMEKVIECLQTDQHGVLESPTGTGKTLSLLCASLAWLTIKKAQVQADWHAGAFGDDGFMPELELDAKAGQSNKRNKDSFSRVPNIIYSSRTHSQLSQAMQELKRTAYCQMSASILGGREQLCIHPEIVKEPSNAAKTAMCNLKVKSRSCLFHNRVERCKDDTNIVGSKVLDIEDLVKLGTKHRFCPYYMAKELRQRSDITFMPYNYLLDANIRKSLNISLNNTIVILDEAHNIERICEDSASTQISTTEISLAIDEVTAVMKSISENAEMLGVSEDILADLRPDDLCTLKETLLRFEGVLDEIEVKNEVDGATFPGNYIFDVLSQSEINEENKSFYLALIDKITEFLSAAGDGPFQRKGNGLVSFSNLLQLAFAGTGEKHLARVKKCYKVHVISEKPVVNNKGAGRGGKSNTWLSKHQQGNEETGRLFSFWCFSPGFGMNLLMEQDLKCLILTSGTLAPLRPLISELELKADVRLENPHIVKSDQVCVKIICKGPDGEELNSSFRNRGNPKYTASLGMTIVNVTRLIPGGLLIFFSSYPVMKKCQEEWQESGIWTTINKHKPILVEPREKEAFDTAMKDYYDKINDPVYKGAIFMGVCRGKVSEGLDFANANGRGVIITGLPYPPLKDPRVVLKRQYMDICNRANKEYLTGSEWYNLEASRAVNQAIGRVIRHRYDYGVILLLDSRFNSNHIRSKMSLWLRDRIEVVQNFGSLIRDMKCFFTNAEIRLPKPELKPIEPPPKSLLQTALVAPSGGDSNSGNKSSYFSYLSGVNGDTCSGSSEPSGGGGGLVKIHERKPIGQVAKKRKIVLTTSKLENKPETPTTNDTHEYIAMVKSVLNPPDFKLLVTAVSNYRDSDNFNELISTMDTIFQKKYNTRYLIQGMQPYIKSADKQKFQEYWEKMR